MYVQNKAIQISREGRQHHLVRPQGSYSNQCFQAMKTLRSCLKNNSISVLDHQKAKSVCDTNQWKNNCTGKWRRYHCEQIYREQLNQRLYNQKQLETYMESKNNYTHSNIL